MPTLVKQAEAASLRVLSLDGNSGVVRSMCTGFAIGPRRVWTAKHCVDAESNLRIVQGEGRGVAVERQGTATFGDFIGDTDEVLPITGVGTLPVSDLAYAELAESVDSWIEVESADLTVGSVAFLVGYGQRNGLIGRRLKGYVEVIHTDEKDMWGKAASDDGYGKGACIGDSGAGLFSLVRGQLAVVAFLSQGHARCNGADRYVRLTQQ